MSTILYHTTPTNIETFKFDDGVHMGGIYSSLEAGLRKINSINVKNNTYLDTLYIYSFKLSSDIKILQSKDVGNYEAWLSVIQEARDIGAQVVKYKNIYEPDFNPSYIILDNTVVNIIDKQTISTDVAIDKLDILFQ